MYRNFFEIRSKTVLKLFWEIFDKLGRDCWTQRTFSRSVRFENAKLGNFFLEL